MLELKYTCGLTEQYTDDDEHFLVAWHYVRASFPCDILVQGNPR